eukprot:2365540-Pleurochrysis_carterae.AAC.2
MRACEALSLYIFGVVVLVSSSHTGYGLCSSPRRSKVGKLSFSKKDERPWWRRIPPLQVDPV